jgi:hypothetical protein
MSEAALDATGRTFFTHDASPAPAIAAHRNRGSAAGRRRQSHGERRPSGSTSVPAMASAELVNGGWILTRTGFA